MVNILKKIKTKTYNNKDLISNIDLNPIVSYPIIKEIVNSDIYDVDVINKLKAMLSMALYFSDHVVGKIISRKYID